MFVLSTLYSVYQGAHNNPVVERLYYKLEGRWFDSRWDYCISRFNSSFQPQCCPGVVSAPSKDDLQDSSCGVKSDRPARKAYDFTAICEHNVGSLDVS
jgi:hypothetical protein